VEPADAQDILRRSDNDRRVVLAAKLEILNAQPVVNDRTLTLNVRILEYVIWSNSKHIQLGKVVVKR
jgi:hypothetical protein